MSPSRFRANTVLPAPMNVILAMRAGYGVPTTTGSLRRMAKRATGRLRVAISAVLLEHAAGGCVHELGRRSRPTTSTTRRGDAQASTTTTPTTSTTARALYAAAQSRAVQRDVRLRRRDPHLPALRSAFVPRHDGRPVGVQLPRLRLERGAADGLRQLQAARRPHNFLIVAPDGQGERRHYNLTNEKGLQNDIKMVLALLDRIEATFCVDTARVFSTGMSDGGAMTSVLACLASDRFAAFGAVRSRCTSRAAAATGRSRSSRSTGRPIGSCRSTEASLRRPGVTLGAAPTTMAAWAEHDHCDAAFVDDAARERGAAPHVVGLRRLELGRLLHHRRWWSQLAGLDPDRAVRADHPADQRERDDLGLLHRRTRYKVEVDLHVPVAQTDPLPRADRRRRVPPDAARAVPHHEPVDAVGARLGQRGRRRLAVVACFDCHSNETKNHWWTRIAPMSWLTVKDVREGRDKLNFSECGTGSEGDPLDNDTKDIYETIADGSMPPSRYTMFGLHKDAKLTEAERAELIAGLRRTLGEDSLGGKGPG